MNKAVIGFLGIATLIGTPAFAADMALKAPPIPLQIYSWSGCYVGRNDRRRFGRSSYSGNPTGDLRTPEPVGRAIYHSKSFSDYEGCTRRIERDWRR